MKKNSFYNIPRDIVYEDFIYDILDRDVNNKEILEERMKIGKLKFGKKLIVFVFDISKYKSSNRYLGYLRDMLESLFLTKNSIYYNNSVVIIYG